MTDNQLGMKYESCNISEHWGLRLSSGEKRTYPGNALDGNLSNSFFETGESRVDFPDLSLFSLDQLLDDLTGKD